MKSKNSKKNIEKKKVILTGYRAYVAVVQLEERFPAKEEVIGSNPIGYTITEFKSTRKGVFYCSHHDHCHSKCDLRISPVIGWLVARLLATPQSATPL